MAHDTSYKQLLIITRVACLSGWIKVLLYTTFTILSKGSWLVALLVFRDTVHMYTVYGIHILYTTFDVTCTEWPVANSENQNSNTLFYSQLASFPGSPGTQICITGRAWYLFYVWRKKGIALRIVQSTMRLTLGVCDIRPLMARYVSRYLRSFSCSETWVCPCTIKVVLHVPRVYFRQCSREKKYQALHTCTTSMFTFRSMGAWERGYIAAVLTQRADRSYSITQNMPQTSCPTCHLGNVSYLIDSALVI